VVTGAWALAQSSAAAARHPLMDKGIEGFLKDSERFWGAEPVCPDVLCLGHLQLARKASVTKRS
jgi:hypothetical protein